MAVPLELRSLLPLADSLSFRALCAGIQVFPARWKAWLTRKDLVEYFSQLGGYDGVKLQRLTNLARHLSIITAVRVELKVTPAISRRSYRAVAIDLSRMNS
jgi:hypothetical protein